MLLRPERAYMGSTRSVRPWRAITLTATPGSSGPAARACHRSPWTRTSPSVPLQRVVRPAAPTNAALPVTTGRRRARTNVASTTPKNVALTSAAPTTSGSSGRKPGSPEHHHRPDRERARPAQRQGAEGRDEGLGAHQPDAEQRQRQAGIVDRQQV